jgi:hypothetical protein
MGKGWGEGREGEEREIEMWNKTINTTHNKLQAFLKLLEFRIIGSAGRGERERRERERDVDRAAQTSSAISATGKRWGGMCFLRRRSQILALE